VEQNYFLESEMTSRLEEENIPFSKEEREVKMFELATFRSNENFVL
jgi:hypothetical protein